jgi:hypothetical protein
VEAKGASWVQLLNEMQRRTGIRFHLTRPLQGSITASFEDVPIERALKRLFGSDANFIFFYHNTDPGPASFTLPYEVWVVGKDQGEPAQTPGARSAKAELAASVPEDIGETTDDEATQEVTQTFDMNPQAAQELALSADDPEVRFMAIAYLGQQPNPSAVGVLLEIIRDPDPHVRQSALDGLLPLLDTNPQVRQGLADVLQAAPDSDVRQLVTNVLESTAEPPPEAAMSDGAGDAAERERMDVPEPDAWR